MSDFGVLLSNGSGNPFVTPVSIPMSMYGRYTANAVGNGNYASANGSIPWNPAWPAMVFLKSDLAGVYLSTAKTANSIIFGGSFLQSRAFTVTAYVFGIFPQNPPEWGMIIVDENGQIVLTNETRVLSDLVTVGNSAVANQSGVGMDITLPGSYAVCPKIHGSMLFQTSNAGTGQPIIVNVMAYTSCANSEGNTRFTAAANQAPGGSLIGSTDTRCILTAINTAAYD
jgi:hypothetical protein